MALDSGVQKQQAQPAAMLGIQQTNHTQMSIGKQTGYSACRQPYRHAAVMLHCHCRQSYLL